MVRCALCMVTLFVLGAQQPRQDAERKDGFQLNLPDQLKAEPKAESPKAGGRQLDPTFDPNLVPRLDRVRLPGGLNLSITEVAFWLAVLSLVAGTVAFIYVSNMRRNGQLSESLSFRLLGLILVFTFATFLTVGGYGQQQIASLMAILGAALGYIFAKEDTKKPEVATEPQKSPASH